MSHAKRRTHGGARGGPGWAVRVQPPPTLAPPCARVDLPDRNPMDRWVRIQQLEERLLVLTQYMRSQMAERDWHGVMDCAVDCRDVEAELRGLQRR